MARPVLRWVVRSSDPTRLGGVLAALAVSEALLSEGSIFVNSKRVGDAHRRMQPGDLVEVFELRKANAQCRVVDRRGDLWIVDKPAMLASEPTQQSSESASQQLSDLLSLPVHIHTRLDVGVGGLMLVSTTHEANAHVQRLRERRQLSRQYLAIAHGDCAKHTGVWNAPVGRGPRTQSASTRFQVLDSLTRPTSPTRVNMLLLSPITGRTHQLRQHCSQAKLPLLGDRRYRGELRLVQGDGSVHAIERILLQAVRLTLSDQRGQPWQVTLHRHDLCETWQRLGGELGSIDGVLA